MRQDLFFDFRFMIFDLLCASNRKSAIENRKFFGGHEAETPKFNADSLRQSLHRDARLWDRRADSTVLRHAFLARAGALFLAIAFVLSFSMMREA